MIVCVTESGQGITIEEVISSMALLERVKNYKTLVNKYSGLYAQSVEIVNAFRKEYGETAMPYPDGTITIQETPDECYIADTLYLIKMMLKTPKGAKKLSGIRKKKKSA